MDTDRQDQRPGYPRTALAARWVVDVAGTVAAVVRQLWSQWERARRLELDEDARTRGVAPPGDRFARPLARYLDPMAWQVRHSDRLVRCVEWPGDRLPTVVETASRWQAWTSPHAYWCSALYPGWVGWLPTVRQRRAARRVVARRRAWTRPGDGPLRAAGGRRVTPRARPGVVDLAVARAVARAGRADPPV